LPARYAWRC